MYIIDDKKKAFTLIELLIVVAIIAILAAIAVPNFLEAQTRSKVSRAFADMRSIKTGLESYYVDNNNYILDGNDYDPTSLNDFNCKKNLSKLTTPISYLTSLFIDPFHTSNKGDLPPILTPPPPPYPYIYVTHLGYTEHKGHPRRYYLFSLGPDMDYDNKVDLPYDPTNGTVSDGDIIVYGP